ncbi:tetratricopeptide repeat protein [uncultured Limnohabitans sp.]|uniref:L,D-transpeptidase Cds6 family protein n=1 Tax=uncultured Limnohabitans sp. TaxID=768543 RepID=UPI00262E835E|nr:tetratricopeptide repeat protein [uncultured Limnohabitans sp.]
MKLVRQERKNAPNDVQWYFLEGVVQAQMGQRDKAIDTFTKITELLGSSVWAQSPQEAEDAVKTAIQEGQLDRAMKLVRQERKNAPNDVQWYFLEGVVQAQMGQRDKAIDTFTKITELHPEQSEAYNNLGVLYASKGQLEKSKSFLEKALQTHPSYAAAHRNLSDIHSRLAQQNYAKALPIGPTAKASPPQLTLLGRIGKEREAKAMDTQQASSGKTPPTEVKAQVAAPTKSERTPTDRALAAASPPLPKASASTQNGTAASDKATAEPVKPDTSGVERAVMAWAQAWSDKDMNRYYAAYANDFVPTGRLNRTQWEADRRLKIVSKKSISVGIKQLKIAFNGDTASAKFQQIYASDNFKGNIRKTLDMVRQGNTWLIVRESVN